MGTFTFNRLILEKSSPKNNQRCLKSSKAQYKLLFGENPDEIIIHFTGQDLTKIFHNVEIWSKYFIKFGNEHFI